MVGDVMMTAGAARGGETQTQMRFPEILAREPIEIPRKTIKRWHERSLSSSQ